MIFKSIDLVTNQNSVQVVVKCRVKAENSFYYSVQTVLSFRILPKNLKIKIFETIILLVMLYGFVTWLLTLREERSLREFENRTPRQIFRPKRDGEGSKLRNFVVYT